jgi:hypothetical protein
VPKFRNISGERLSVAVLHGRWVDPDEVITVPDNDLVWPDVTWEPVEESTKKKES